MYHFEMQYRYAKQRMQELERQAGTHQMLRGVALNFRTRLAFRLYRLAEKLEPQLRGDTLAVR